MPDRVFNVLFLCTGNSARSILAEALLGANGGERFRAFSAGAHPRPHVHPLAIELLRANGLPTYGLRSKSWEEFARSGAPRIDCILTVCDNAAGEACPIWPGRPITAHWGIPDPAAVAGDIDEKRQAFRAAYTQLSERISRFIDLPLERLDRASLRQKLEEIADVTGSTLESRPAK